MAENNAVGAEYFHYKIRSNIFLIGCTQDAFGNMIGKEMDFNFATGNSWLIVGVNKALLIDSASPVEGLRKYVESIVDVPIMFVLSHAHFDHIYRINEFDQLWMHSNDEVLLKKHIKYALKKDRDYSILNNINFLDDNYEINLGDDYLIKVINVPGHTDGSLLFFDEKAQLLFTGDTIARRLILGINSDIDLMKFINSLKNLKNLDFSGVCSCHDRKILSRKQIDFMISGLQEFENNSKPDEMVIGETITKMCVIRKGIPTDEYYFSCSIPFDKLKRIKKDLVLLRK